MKSGLSSGLAIALAVCLVSGCSLGWGAEAFHLNINEFRLSNGLDVLILEDHAVPLATVQVWYRVGSRNERPGITGISHFLEHMMFKGTPKYGPGTYSQLIQRYGGTQNAFTSYDMTAYYSVLPAARLDLALDLERRRRAHAGSRRPPGHRPAGW
jgi:zinc protease